MKATRFRKYSIIYLFVSLILSFILLDRVYFRGRINNWYYSYLDRGQSGLRVFYYGNEDFSGDFEKTEIVKKVSYSSSTDKEFQREQFSIRAIGIFSVPRSGYYKFFLRSDDGSRLYIDQNIIIDNAENGGVHPSKEIHKTVFLKKGYHLIVIEYFQILGAAELDLSWLKTKETIRSSDLGAYFISVLPDFQWNKDLRWNNNIYVLYLLIISVLVFIWIVLKFWERINSLWAVICGIVIGFVLRLWKWIYSIIWLLRNHPIISYLGKYTPRIVYLRDSKVCNLVAILHLISSAFMIFTISIFIYCSFISKDGWWSQTWLFGTFLIGAIFLKVIWLFVGFKKENSVFLKKIYRVLIIIFSAIVLSVIFLLWGSMYVMPAGRNIERLPILFFIIPFCIVLFSRFNIKWHSSSEYNPFTPYHAESPVWKDGEDECNHTVALQNTPMPRLEGRGTVFTIPVLLLCLSIVYIELQKLGEGRLISISSLWRYCNNIHIYYFRYFILLAFSIIIVFILNMFHKKTIFIEFINKRKRLSTVIFMLITVLCFVTMRKRVTFGGDNWELLLHSVGDCIYFKYPLVFILPYWNFLLFKNWLSLDVAYNSFCLFAGFIMFIQMFRLWNLLWPEDITRRFYGRLLTMIPYGTAQFFFGYSGRRVIELAFFTSLIYYAVLLIKRGKGYFWIGLLTALTFSSHVVHILTVPAIALACYLASEKEKWHKRMFYGVQCLAGFLIGYAVVYGYIGNLRVLPTILFNHDSTLVQEELLAKVGSLRNMFDLSYFDNFRRIADYINLYGPIGLLLIVVVWLSHAKRLFVGSRNIAIFLGVLAASCLSWFPWKIYSCTWANFDQFVASFIILNIFAVYMWLASNKNIKEFVLPASILIAVFGTYSITLIDFMHNHRHDINVSFKGKPQSIIGNNCEVIDKLDFGNYFSERKHNFKIEKPENRWGEFFYYPGTSYKVHSHVSFNLIRNRDVLSVVSFYKNREAVADEGRLCKGSTEFVLKAKPGFKHFIIWRTMVANDTGKVPAAISKSIHNAPVEVIINAERIGLWKMEDPIMIHPERKLNNYVWIDLPAARPKGPFEYWHEFKYEIPPEFIKGKKMHLKLVPTGGTMQMYYMWLCAESS